MLTTAHFLLAGGLSLVFSLPAAAQDQGVGVPYPIVDTGQDRCYDDNQEITAPAKGGRWFGQDGQYEGRQPAYRDNGDGTVSDLATGLMWEKAFDQGRKQTFAEARANAATCRAGGHSDWRLPTIKELYSLIDFRGLDTNPTIKTPDQRPFIDTRVFDFIYGDTGAGDRIIDAQYWSANEYVGRTMRGDATVFGVNFADGRIKGYPRDQHPGARSSGHFVRYVRGNPAYGRNDFHDNGDGTITDRATGLVWQKGDSGKPMAWEAALSYAAGLTLTDAHEWRLPDAKELQSIVDYGRAPDAVEPAPRGPAIDPVFQTTEPESYFWTSTTHLARQNGSRAVYLCFGRALGFMQFPGQSSRQLINVHGAGAQRSDPKSGDPGQFPQGRGPQGDDIRIFNYVRCVRGGPTTLRGAAALPGGTNHGFRTQQPGPNRLPGQTPDQGMNPNHPPPPAQNKTKEFQSVLPARPSPVPSSPAQPSRFISRLDRDGDGKVSPAEFDGPPDGFARFDRNQDGFITADEAPQGPPPRPR